jgi:hypothetical protein
MLQAQSRTAFIQAFCSYSPAFTHAQQTLALQALCVAKSQDAVLSASNRAIDLGDALNYNRQ